MSLAVFSDWPAGRSPQEIGKRVAENFASRPLMFEGGSEPVHYREACAWYGALTYAARSGDGDLDRRLIEKFEPLLKPAGAAYHPARDHVDDRVFGITPLEIFLHNGDRRQLELGKGLANAQWIATTPDGITSEARYWVDDMFMITALQVQAFRATKDAGYLHRTAKTLAAYLDRLQQPSGLFFHTLSSPVYWGRGNGWVAAGMTELLRSLPVNHPYRERILDGYRKMMAALLRYQTPGGVWRQVLDYPGSWVETSGSAMFAFAFVTGVDDGWLDPAIYGAAARAAWLGTIEYLDSNADLREVCVGTGEAMTVVGNAPAAQLQYYLDRQRIAGDFHGQAPVLWCASALLR